MSNEPEELEVLAHDIAGRGPWASSVVVRPGSVAQVQAVVQAAAGAGQAIVPRGGGMSYTGGYQPSGPGAVLLDMTGVAQVGTVAAVDGFVIVEAGCTWGALYDALAVQGLRTPFFGPLSGNAAT
ncbi:MAG: FAD-binding oxidoreductase, partial [Alsobacter sp.]